LGGTGFELSDKDRGGFGHALIRHLDAHLIQADPARLDLAGHARIGISEPAQHLLAGRFH
jgi:hypothetical protein